MGRNQDRRPLQAQGGSLVVSQAIKSGGGQAGVQGASTKWESRLLKLIVFQYFYNPKLLKWIVFQYFSIVDLFRLYFHIKFNIFDELNWKNVKNQLKS